MYEITGLMACDFKGLIGCKGALPWYNKSENSHFRKMIANQVVIMGRKTFESMPQDIFESSIGVVFSKEKREKKPNIIFVTSLKDFLGIRFNKHKKLFMIGGAEIAHLFLQNDLILEFILTIMNKPYKGDVFFNLDMMKSWKRSIIIEHDDYNIYQLLKVGE